MYAANSSCERRSSREGGGVGFPFVEEVKGETAPESSLARPSRAVERRPHWGQTARLSVPVD
jgi:hypothetical protein